jgi:GLPGLI family protein
LVTDFDYYRHICRIKKPKTMKKIVFASFLVFSYLATHAQKDFQGMAVYESKTSTADFKSRFEGNREITPEMQKMIEERMKKMFEKTFFLNFDKSASIYKEEEKLETPGQGGGGMRMMSSFMGGGGTYYKNVKDKTYKVDKEFMGKEFLVKDSLKTYNWQMSGETRVIGGYNCFKATAVIPASKTDFRNFRPKKEEEKKDDKAKEETKVEVAVSAPAMTNQVSTSSDRVKVSPLAKKMAEDHGISLNGISGSGDEGRITKKDIEEALKSASLNIRDLPGDRLNKVLSLFTSRR